MKVGIPNPERYRDTLTVIFYTYIPLLCEEEIVLCFSGSGIWVFGGGTGMIILTNNDKIQVDMAKLWQEKSPGYQNRRTIRTADSYKLDDFHKTTLCL